MRKASLRRLRIAYCLDSFNIGGTEINAVRAAESLDPNRFEISVFHLSTSGPLRARYEKMGVSITHIEIPNLYSLRTMLQGAYMSGLLRRSGVDIVHSHDIYCNIFMVPWARMLTSCSVIASRRWGSMASRPRLAGINRFAYKFAHKVLGNSETIARLLVDVDRVASHKIIQVPNFVEEQAFESAAIDARDAQRRAWGLPAAVLVIGIVARLSPVKNHASLFRAIAGLDARYHLVVVGDGPCRSELESLASALDIASQIHFVGEVTPGRNLHQYFDISVLCSLSEGFPNSLIEAMAAGRPIVATSVGGILDAVEDGVNGILVPSDDPARLARAIHKLEKNPALCAQFGEAGRAVAREKFHQNAVISKLAEFYEALAEQRLEGMSRQC